MQILIFLLKMNLTGVSYVIMARLNLIVVLQFAMVLGSIFLWLMLSPTDDKFVFLTLVTFLKQNLKCHQDIACIAITLFFSHICSIFYCVAIGKESNILAVISFTLFAIYIHTIFFLIIYLLMRTMSYVLIFVMNDRSNRNSVALLAIIFAVCGLWVAMSPPNIRYVTIKIRNLPLAQIGFRIALLSDLHVGPTVGHSNVQKMVDIINSIGPDVIAISGDLADGFVKQLKKAVCPLKNLTPRYGTFFATGNHEYLHGNVNEWFTFLKKIGIIPLHNGNKKISINESVVCIAGADDLFAQYSRIPGHAMNYRKALRRCNKNDTTIILIHQPNAAQIILRDIEIAENVDLILSGHTHAGQMYLFIPLVYIWNAFFHGLYYDKTTETYVYVSAGVNYFGPPVKILGKREITLITLLRK
ncbi:unnamed protein product [Thelazia callipaeda]|uniref:Metallophos domain-containing protein n=1 Tax=Thelazia callipaeda TaxID=103827 RepID=A0A0N5D2I8_THECL|nr:unnamed protein product [Thelazia callipaeda]